MQAYLWVRRTVRRTINQGSRLFYRAGWSGVVAYVIWAEHSREDFQLLSAPQKGRVSRTPLPSRTSGASTNPDEVSGGHLETSSLARTYLSSIRPEVMPKKLSKQELEARELRSHSTIRKATEVVESYGKPSTKAEVQHLGSVFRKTLESLCPDLFGVTRTSTTHEPLEEPGVGSSTDFLEPAPVSFRSPRFASQRTGGPITFEEAARLQNGFCVPVYLIVYPSEARGIYVGSWVQVECKSTSLSRGRRWLIDEGPPERYFDAV